MVKVLFRPVFTRIASTVLCIVLLWAANPAVARALSQDQLEALSEGAVYFNTEDSSCSVAVDINLSGNDNIQKAFNFFISKGLEPYQSAAIVGNLMAESSVNPSVVAPPPKDGVGFGIAQWTFTARQAPLVQLAQDKNIPITDLGLQLEYVWDELNGIAPARHEAGLSQLKAAKNVDDAASGFMGWSSTGGPPGYENPQYPDIEAPKREKNAEAVLEKYGGGASATSNIATSVASGGCSNIAGAGQDTKFVDNNFILYSQCDPAWATQPYGTDTICSSGCGPTAMAMIITNLTGTQVTPPATASYADSQGLYVVGSGSSWAIASKLATHWGLRSKAVGANVATISAALQAGALVIAAGQGPVPYTPGGHYIVIRGVTADGKWKIADPDPAHKDASTTAWDPAQLVANMNDGSVYAISK